MHEHMLEPVKKCEAICLETITHCVTKGGEHANVDHINILIDCALICQLNASAMVRHSPASKALMQLCADVCDACTKSCERMADDEQMQRCAEACRTCAKACRE